MMTEAGYVPFSPQRVICENSIKKVSGVGCQVSVFSPSTPS
ncbi:hypothetical protein D1AOALGA4SA_6431 [Olavius algarvensis Delta 1 endosymbiont]|nr:hypothetical protein D1AOALGA4SA_6431 [Olavius algarvensis Delta 1 endosymbiont]